VACATFRGVVGSSRMLLLLSAAAAVAFQQTSVTIGVDSKKGATVKVVARLSEGGYIERTRHPSDRRVLLLGTLPGAHERVRKALGPMHERMMRLASSFDHVEREVIVRFLDGLVEVVETAPSTDPA